jgi:hypothetical protein
MKAKKLIACALLIVLLVGILGTAAASPLRVYAYASATGKSIQGTTISVWVDTRTTPPKNVYYKSGDTNNGYYSFEIPSQYTGQSYKIHVVATASYQKKMFQGDYAGSFKTSVNIAMKQR